MTECGHWDGSRYCGRTLAVRQYLPGPRCPIHTPARLNGHPEAAPDPTLTLTALRAARGLAGVTQATSGLIDERAIATGKRRASAQTYAAARASQSKRRTP